MHSVSTKAQWKAQQMGGNMVEKNRIQNGTSLNELPLLNMFNFASISFLQRLFSKAPVPVYSSAGSPCVLGV